MFSPRLRRFMRRMRGGWTICLMLLALGACTTPGVQTASTSQPCVQEGVASWYRPQVSRKPTADGETPGESALTAAHPSLPFGTRVRVTNLETGKSVVVRISDRGPVARGRIIDLSTAAADALEMRHDGTARVRLEMYHPTGGMTADAVAKTDAQCPLTHPVES